VSKQKSPFVVESLASRVLQLSLAAVAFDIAFDHIDFMKQRYLVADLSQVG
jgi:hypothetical protein